MPPRPMDLVHFCYLYRADGHGVLKGLLGCDQGCYKLVWLPPGNQFPKQ